MPQQGGALGRHGAVTSDFSAMLYNFLQSLTNMVNIQNL